MLVEGFFAERHRPHPGRPACATACMSAVLAKAGGGADIVTFDDVLNA